MDYCYGGFTLDEGKLFMKMVSEVMNPMKKHGRAALNCREGGSLRALELDTRDEKGDINPDFSLVEIRLDIANACTVRLGEDSLDSLADALARTSLWGMAHIGG